ncbi:Nematode fatty acid retinoid binding family-containing protein [Strongyloides ratti]|uniref:Nematode fatty acid retinoid binding family-containing protein n=1 Tax=Strongyloides ratti TaxID=34506 RepID=A0A090MZ22_STRRB|nr:Nematode fatty acid retinoid binding family-containing protein [Strongyloides ratti]CEF68179.1 Nematode fatty acid retinoid binding family-containing protein [Strongyloides ratti]
MSDDLLESIINYFPKDANTFLESLTPEEMTIATQIAGEKPLTDEQEDWNEFLLVVRDQSEPLYRKIIKEVRKEDEKVNKLSYKGRQFIKKFQEKQKTVFQPHGILVMPMAARMSALELFLNYLDLPEIEKEGVDSIIDVFRKHLPVPL